MTTVVERTREIYEQDELPPELRWIEDLSPRHQRRLYAELQIEWSRYCLTQDPSGLTEFFDDWQATAEADASPDHARFLLSEQSEGDYEEWPSKEAS